MSLQLTITNRTRAAIDLRWLKRELVRAMKLLKIREAEWSITIVGDRAMADLHARTMDLPTTTDVLTFDLREEGAIGKTKEGCGVELETVLCRDEAARQAKERGHTVLSELLLYGIHSLLHVQGYDDLRAADAARMHRREDELLIALGVGPVYSNTGRAVPSRPPRKRP